MTDEKVRDEALGHLRAAQKCVERIGKCTTRALVLSAIAEAIRYLERH